MNIRTIAIGFIVVMAFVGGIVWQNQMQKAQQEQAPMAQQQAGGDMGAMGDGADPHAGGGMPGMPAEEAPHPGVEWNAPKSWKDLGPRSMRVATYGVPKAGGDGEDAECAVFYFGQGQGGGVDENIDRWIGQLEQPGQPERAKFEVGPFKVHRVAVNGTYTAPSGPMMQATDKKSAYRLVGAIVEGPQGSVFFKMTGPEKTTRGAEKDFDAMLKSLHQ